MRTPGEYIEGLKKMKKKIYVFGTKVENYVDHPLIRPVVNSIALTFSTALSKELQPIMCTTSHLTGKLCNRFLQVHLTVDDYLKRLEQNYVLMMMHGSCVGGRCVGNDAINATYSITYEMDKKLGTDYHRRFCEWLKMVQEKDLVVSGAITDVKGDRSKGPSEQADAMYLRVVEKREGGIVIRGAKAHQSGAVAADWHLLGPTVSMSEKDKDFALICAVPGDAEGLIHVYECPAGNVRRLFEDLDIDLGNPTFGVHGSSLMIFDDVFVPWEHVFMCGEWQFTWDFVRRFANYHRCVFSMCHAAIAELLAGAAAAIAEFNGLNWRKVSHIRDKITNMVQEAALAKAAAIGSVVKAWKTESGVLVPDDVMINSAKLQAVKATLDNAISAVDIAGGIVGTIPSERDLKNPEIEKYLRVYLKGNPKVPVEDRMRMIRLIEYLVGQSSLMIPVTLHAGGSPETQKVFIRMFAEIEKFKEAAMRIAKVRSASEQ
jgi:4-hydroxybutyryl-CoA dehydratase/vinylacetyl-CoA-Delta-isomerase